jgi:hypothetical protein
LITANKVIEYDPEHDIRVVVVGDQHYGSSEFRRARYLSFLEDNMGHPNTFLVAIGDVADSITMRDPRFELGGLDKKILHSEFPDDIVDHQVQMFVDDHRQYATDGKIIGIGMGNHENVVRIRHSTNVTRRICKELGVMNLGYSALLSLKLRPLGAEHRGMFREFNCLFHHGWGGSNSTEGGAMTTYAKHSGHFDNIDAAFYGHKHDYMYKRVSRVGIDQAGNQKHRDIVVALVGTFLKTFNAKADPSWAETKGFPPRFLRGGWIMKLTPVAGGGVFTRMSEG